MKYQHSLLPIVMCLYTALAYAEDGEETAQIQDIYVTAPQSKSTLISVNPRKPIQPLPVTDGSGLLKIIPNMNVTRKGGSSGDPLFRGLGGSRLNITASDNFVFGGCGGRMDPPTAYIFPEAYDEVVITKGPQSVTKGSGLVAGSVEFKRKQQKYDKPTFNAMGSLTYGSFNRTDAFAETSIGTSWGYARVNAIYNKSDDYKDGKGNQVHSHYERNSQMIQLGLTPTENTLFELSYDRSRGEAAYADRGMDGSKFDRDSYTLRFEQKNIAQYLDKISLNYGYSYIDHVMDNFSLRKSKGMKMLGNPDRKVQTAKLQFDLGTDHFQSQIGLDLMQDLHRGRGGMDYQEKMRMKNQQAKNIGIYAENTWYLNEQQKLIFGLRHDRSTVNFYDNNMIIKDKTYHLNSAFLRYEYDMGLAKYFIGYGQADRLPDFWERNRNDNLKKESNHEIDGGVIIKGEKTSASFTGFASQVNNYILIMNNPYKRGQIGRNIKAQRYGFELEGTWNFYPNWSWTSSMAYTFAKNKTDNTWLAQTPPLEFKNSLNFTKDRFSVGLLMRTVAAQNHIAKGQGNIIGMDTTKTKGFTVFSLNSSWKINKYLDIFAGIDNLFNKQYAEHVNRTPPDAAIAGYTPYAGKIPEPGRQFWLKLQGKF